jgi:hypothetical protein
MSFTVRGCHAGWPCVEAISGGGGARITLHSVGSGPGWWCFTEVFVQAGKIHPDTAAAKLPHWLGHLGVRAFLHTPPGKQMVDLLPHPEPGSAPHPLPRGTGSRVRDHHC